MRQEDPSMRSNRVVQAILQPATVIRLKQKRELGWEAEYGIDEMCADSWKWQTQNPNGYNDPE